MCGSASHLDGGETVADDESPNQSLRSRGTGAMAKFEKQFQTGAHTWRAPGAPGERDFQVEIDKVNARIAELQALIDAHAPSDDSPGSVPGTPRTGPFVRKRFEPDLRSNSWRASDGIRQRSLELHGKYNRELANWQRLQQKQAAKSGGL